MHILSACPTTRVSGCLYWYLTKLSVVLLLIATPIVGFCNWSMFCALLCVHSSFAIILMGEERAGCFALLGARECCVAFLSVQRV